MHPRFRYICFSEIIIDADPGLPISPCSALTPVVVVDLLSIWLFGPFLLPK